MYTKRIVVLMAMALSGLWVGNLHAIGSGMLDHATGWYPAGTNLTVTATPDTYYLLDRWDGDTGSAAVVEAQIAFGVDGSRSITAVFAPILTEAGSVPQYWLADVNPDWTNDFERAATNDWDGDGFTGAQEYWSGTDPTNSASYLHISGLERSADGFQLVWQHARVDARIPPIRVEVRTNLMQGAWVSAGEIAPVDGTNNWVVAGDAIGYYRLRAPGMTP